MNLNQDQWLGIIRHSLTFIGGILVTKGLVDETLWAEISGGALALVGAVWSILAKK